MATYDLDQTEFVDTLTNFDPDTINSILNYLHAQGIYTNPNDTAVVQITGMPPLDPTAQIAEFSANSFTVDTDSDTSIHAILATGLGDNTAILQGQQDVLLGTGNGNDVLADQSSGNNELLGGSGNDSVFATGSGTDTIDGGGGNDIIGRFQQRR